ncbi:MAG: transcription antitermination factor NusB [Lachnospiraceae bacterium]|nr:transcription antitermination factor NusB [Lachnospiraceae bacterium]
MSLSRHKKREQLFKLLFRLEFHDEMEMEEQKRLFFGERPDGEPELTEEDISSISGKFDNITGKLTELDAMVSERTSGWDINRIGKVELAILRLALYEMIYDEDVPESVAINEAVELSKKYGQDNSSSFVNGVLALFAQKAEDG